MNRHAIALLIMAAVLPGNGVAEDFRDKGRRLATSSREDAQTIGGEVYKFSIPNQSARFSIVVREKLTEDAKWREIASYDLGRHHDDNTYEVLISFMCGKTVEEGYPAKHEGQMNLSLSYSWETTRLGRCSEGFWTAIDRPFGRSTEWPFEVRCAAVGDKITWHSKKTICLLEMTPRGIAKMDNDKFVPVAEICIIFREDENAQAEDEANELLLASLVYLCGNGHAFSGSTPAFSSGFRAIDVDRVYLNEGAVNNDSVKLLRRFPKLKHIAIGPNVMNLPLDSPTPALSNVATQDKKALQATFPNISVDLEDLSGRKAWETDSSGHVVPVIH